MEAFPATELIMTTGYLALVLGFLLQPGRIGHITEKLKVEKAAEQAYLIFHFILSLPSVHLSFAFAKTSLKQN